MPRFASVVFSGLRGGCKRKIYLHMDNARSHTLKRLTQCVEEMKFKRISHPLYSLDIIPNDFYLFETIKQQLQTCQGGSYEDLQVNVHEILAAIDPIELAVTMRAWMACLQKVINTNGEYA
jgi:hypothetical protein